MVGVGGLDAGTVRRVVQCGAAVREGFVGGVVAGAQRGRVCVSAARDNVSLSLPVPPFAVSGSGLRCVFFFCFAWDLCNSQMYDAGGYPVDAAVPDIGYSALAALPTLPSNLGCSTTHAQSLMDQARPRLGIATMQQS